MLFRSLAFPALTDADTLEVTSNGALETMRIEADIGSITIEENDSLVTLELPALDSGSRIGIFGCDALADLDGLAGVTRMGSLWVDGNASLASVAGLSTLTSTSSWLWFADNDALTDLTGLESVASVGGDLGIVENDALIDVTALSGVKIGRAHV